MPVPGMVGVVVGIVVGAVVGAAVGCVVGAVVGRVGAAVGAVVFSGFLLRHPVSANRVRTAARETQRIFFILKPPEITDFTASISTETAFTLEKTAQLEKSGENFTKLHFNHCYFENCLV